MHIRRLVVPLLMLLVSLPALAVPGTGRIQGRVVNIQENKGIGGVTIQVFKEDIVVLSDEDGGFVIENLGTGNYTLLLARGNDQIARIVAVTDGSTTVADVEVDWLPGEYERVKVTAAAARAAKIVDAPAAITSVAEEQIERDAAPGQLPKILEFTPGAEVTQSGLYDFNFNTRGFNSSLNRRVSTYIDGRDVGVVLLGAQEWAAISILDDLANLEFIRGPSAALYGANASSGVINMTTKAPRESQGGMFRTAAGELDTVSSDFRWADGLGKGWYYKILGGFRDTGDFSVTRDPGIDPLPEYSTYCDEIGEVGCLQPEQRLFREQDNEIRFGSIRADKYLTDDSFLTFEGGLTKIEGPAFQTGIGRVQIIDAERPWARFGYSRPHWNVLAHWAKRDAQQVSLAKGLEFFDPDLYSDSKRYGFEAQGNWNFGGDRGRFVIGAAHTEERVDTTDPETGEQTILYRKIDTNRQAIFSQFDWRLNKRFKLVFAGRVDKNTLHSTQFSPKAAMVYNLSPSHTFRMTFNKAFQVANYSEFFLRTDLSTFNLQGLASVPCTFLPDPVADCPIKMDAPILAVGNDDLKLERTQAWEVGYSAILAKRAFLTVDYYRSDNEDFITDLLRQKDVSLARPLTAADCPDTPPELLFETDGSPLAVVNPDYCPWVGNDISETTNLPFPPPNNISVAQGIRNAVQVVTGGEPLGFQLAQDLDGSTVIIARTYANVGQVETQGVDLGMQWFVTNSWNLQASYSWFDFNIEDSNVDVREILLPNSPEHKASMSIAFTKSGWNVSASGRWVDEFFWSAGVFQGPVPAYYTTDVAVSYTFRDRAQIALNVANATDNIHRQTFGGDLLGRRAVGSLTFFW